MRVLMTGGTGMIGTALVKSLLANGHQFWVLTRNPRSAHLPAGVCPVGWDGWTTAGWGKLMSQVDAVVNLVGEGLSKWPWTKKQRQRFWNSRVDGGRALVEAIQAASTAPVGAHSSLRRKLLRTSRPGPRYRGRFCRR